MIAGTVTVTQRPESRVRVRRVTGATPGAAAGKKPRLTYARTRGSEVLAAGWGGRRPPGSQSGARPAGQAQSTSEVLRRAALPLAADRTTPGQGLKLQR
eukprot:679027-Hanusia_phi.AAC.1